MVNTKTNDGSFVQESTQSVGYTHLVRAGAIYGRDSEIYIGGDAYFANNSADNGGEWLMPL